MASYLGTFNPAVITQNFIADIGNSPNSTGSFSFNLAAGARTVIVVSEVAANAGCSGYTMNVTGLDPTSATLVSLPNPSRIGQRVTLTATISPAVATGTVHFLDGATQLGIANISGGRATLTTTALALGSHSLTAAYSGDTIHLPSTSPALTHVVELTPSSTALASAPNPSSSGQPVTLTATISPASATGTVQFFDGATPLGTSPVAGGVATLSAPSLTTGTHSLTAAYSGDAALAGSTSPPVSQIVNAAQPTPTPTPTAGPRVFLFAEGTTRTGFYEQLDLANAGNQLVSVQVDFQLSPDTPGPNASRPYVVAPKSTLAIDVASVVGDGKDVSLTVRETGAVTGVLVAERQVYFERSGWTGLHGQVGVSAPALSWYFGEGTTLAGFDEFLTIQNPDPATAATVRITYQPDGCAGPPPPMRTVVVGPASRSTVSVADPVHPAGAGGAVCTGLGATLEVIAGPPVVAERPLYFVKDFGSGVTDDGTDAFGATAPATQFRFAEGTTLPGFNEFLTFANPGTADATASIAYSDETGAVTQRSVVVPAGKRTTVQVYNADSPGGLGPDRVGVSAQITSNQPIVAERVVYVHRDVGSGLVTGGHVAQGSDRLVTRAAFASGSDAAGFDTFLTVLNPDPTLPATLTIELLSPSGSLGTVNRLVGPNTRATFRYDDLGLAVGSGPIGLVMMADRPVVAERPEYVVASVRGLKVSGAANATAA